MTTLTFRNINKIGLIDKKYAGTSSYPTASDDPTHFGWDIKNAAITDSGFEETLNLLTLTSTISYGTPYAVFAYETGEDLVVIYFSSTNAYLIDYLSDLVFEITNASYDYDSAMIGTSFWTSSYLNGVVVFNNSYDPPQYWSLSPDTLAIKGDLGAGVSLSDVMTVANDTVFAIGTDNFTVTWAGRLADWASGTNQALIHKYQSGSPTKYINLYVLSTGYLQVSLAWFGTDTLNVNTTVATGLSDRAFGHITAVVTRETASAAGSVDFYVNGTLLESITITAGAPTNFTNTGILYLQVSSETVVQTVLWYDRALSSAEVLSLYTDGVATADQWGDGAADYTSDFSTGANSWSAINGAVNGNIDSIGGLNDWLRFTIAAGAGNHYINRTIPQFTNQVYYKVTFTYYIPSTNSHIDGIQFSSPFYSTETQSVLDTATTVTVYLQASGTHTPAFYAMDGASNYFNDTGADDVFYVRGITIIPLGAVFALLPAGIAAGSWVDSANSNDASYPSNGDYSLIYVYAHPVTRLTDLANWPADTTCKHMAAYKNYLIAVNITKSNLNYPTLVKWSNAAVPGAAPTSWDETDATNDAGEFPLSNTTGALIDAVTLRDDLILYKTDSVVRMRWVGGQDVFRFDTISESLGLLQQGCVVEYTPGWHVMISAAGRVYKHNGQEFTEIGQDKIKDLLIATYGTAAVGSVGIRGQVVVNPSERKVYFGDGSSGTYMYKTLTWDWERDVWNIYDPSVYFYHMSRGPYYKSVSGVPTRYTGDSIWVAVTEDDLVQQFNKGSLFASGIYFETDVMDFSGVDRNGRYISDPSEVKLIKSVTPLISYTAIDSVTGPPIFTITVTAKSQQGYSVGAEALSTVSGSWNPTTSTHFDCLIEGTHYWVKFTLTSEAYFQFHGFMLELERIGRTTK